MKSILLYVSDDSTMEARLQSALDLARSFDAHLTCLQAMPFEVIIGGDTFVTAYVATELVEEFQQRQEEQRATLEKRLTSEGVRWNWLTLNQEPELALIGQAGLADVVVLGLPGAQEPGKARSLISSIAVTVRAPVLAVPGAQRAFDCDGPAIVAWNGSMESAHALRASLPLLAKAASVHVVTVTDDRLQMPAAAAAEYLSRHGVKSELCDWQRGKRRVSEVLVEGAKALGCTYMVAGAYGHTRFREAILGGVTRELIEAASIPLLITH